MIGRIIAGLLFVAIAVPAQAENAPGISAGEIKIGQTMPYSGPVVAYSALGKGEMAYFKMLNDQGGVNGRKINMTSLDDGYIPAKTVEQTRKMIEQEGVAFIFSPIGTATNTSITKYLNDRKIPHLFLGSGASKWTDYKEHPWTIGGVLTPFRLEAAIYTRHILKNQPNAKIALLYQNDDFGKDYVLGVKDVLGDKYDKMVVEASYEFTDPTVDSQMVSLQGSGATALIAVATPKFAAQAIRRAYDIGWKPMFFITSVSVWVNSVLVPAGVEKAVGLMSGAYYKDPADPAWEKDPGMEGWRAFMRKYLSETEMTDQNYVNAAAAAQTLAQVLKQCGDDLSRENIMRQSTNLRDVELPELLPGIKINTSPTNYAPIREMQLMRWDGKRWVRFGDVLSGS